MNENTSKAKSQVNVQTDRLRNLADKVCSAAIELEERLGPVLNPPEVKDGTAEADESRPPLVRELKDTGDILETALGTLVSILVRLEL